LISRHDFQDLKLIGEEVWGIIEGVNRRIWIKIADSFTQAQQFEKNYCQSMSREERLEVVQVLRERPAIRRTGGVRESRKGLRRTVQIIQQT
jgi:hypothetical protein